MATKPIEEQEGAPEKPKITEADLARKHNHAEINTQLDKHFNGTGKQQKSALGNVETAFGNLIKIKDKK